MQGRACSCETCSSKEPPSLYTLLLKFVPCIKYLWKVKRRQSLQRCRSSVQGRALLDKRQASPSKPLSRSGLLIVRRCLHFQTTGDFLVDVLMTSRDRIEARREASDFCQCLTWKVHASVPSICARYRYLHKSKINCKSLHLLEDHSQRCLTMLLPPDRPEDP